MSNNTLQIFRYKEQQVRTTLIDGEIWFVAKDVCDILEIQNARDAITALDDDERNTVEISDGNRGNPNMNIINEPGLYALVLRSNKPEAKAFSRWVRHDVLPSIRKTGSYSSVADSRALETQMKAVDVERAKILQHMLDAPAAPLSEESRAVIQHEVFKIITGGQCVSMLPAVTEKYYTATEIGEMFGVSSKKIGRIAKCNGLKSEEGSPSQYGQWRLSKSPYSAHQCSTFVYNGQAVEWFREHSVLLGRGRRA